MFNNGGKKKGVVLLIVLGTLLVVVILANVILNIILSQSRLTHHQVSRIQAYYAAQAGMNLALENLRVGAWTYPNNCLNPGDCLVTDTAFPASIQSVEVIFCPAGLLCAGSSTVCTPPANLTFCVTTSVNYTKP